VFSSSLIHLHTLHLCMVFDIEWMLPSLALAPSLRRLIVQPSCDSYRSAPSMPVLCQLMTAAPRLHFTLLLEPTSAEQARGQGWDKDRRAMAAQLRAQVQDSQELAAVVDIHTRCRIQDDEAEAL
jgi:hypothetical protein